MIGQSDFFGFGLTTPKQITYETGLYGCVNGVYHEPLNKVLWSEGPMAK